MVYHERKRARGRPSIHNEGADVPPPPPPKKPSMCVKVSKHHLIPRATLDIFLHGWKVKLDDGKYAKTWITDQRSFDQITPPYIPEKFDILGEKLDKAFLDIAGTLKSKSLTSYLNDLMIGRDAWDSAEDYTLPSESSLELPPLFSQDEAIIPPPPPPPPSASASDTRMEAIGDQLENSQYSPTHAVQYEEDMDIVQYQEDMDTRYSPSHPTDDAAYSPTHPTQDELPRGLHKTSESSSDYLSADEDFPPPAPSPPSIPNTPSPPPSFNPPSPPSIPSTPSPPATPSTPSPPPSFNPPSPPSIPDSPLPLPDSEEDDATITACSLQKPPSSVLRRTLQEPPDGILSTSFRSRRTPNRKNIRQSNRTPSKTQSTPSKLHITPSKRRGAAIGDDYMPQPMDLEDDIPPKICPELDGIEFDELQEDTDAEEEEEEEGALELGRKVAGKDVEDIDSPDELEEEDLLDTDRDPLHPPSQISLFREIITDSGEVKRVLYFRKSKFRMTGTALHQISKMSSKMDYEDACKNTGFPEVFNKITRPADLGTALTDRIEKPKKRLPVKRGFGVPLANLTRSFKVHHDPSTALKMKSFGIPLRQMRGPLLGSQPQRPFMNNPRPMNSNLTRSEQLISEFCACWVQRPFHDARCASTHDNFVETILKRHGVKYAVIKECIKEYSMKIGLNINDPVRSFHQFKSIMKSKFT